MPATTSLRAAAAAATHCQSTHRTPGPSNGHTWSNHVNHNVMSLDSKIPNDRRVHVDDDDEYPSFSGSETSDSHQRQQLHKHHQGASVNYNSSDLNRTQARHHLDGTSAAAAAASSQTDTQSAAGPDADREEILRQSRLRTLHHESLAPPYRVSSGVIWGRYNTENDNGPFVMLIAAVPVWVLAIMRSMSITPLAVPQLAKSDYSWLMFSFVIVWIIGYNLTSSLTRSHFWPNGPPLSLMSFKNPLQKARELLRAHSCATASDASQLYGSVKTEDNMTPTQLLHELARAFVKWRAELKASKAELKDSKASTPRRQICRSIQEVREEFIIKHCHELNSLFKLIDFLQLGSTVNIEAFTCTPKDLRENLLMDTVNNIKSIVCPCMNQTNDGDSKKGDSRITTDMNGAKRHMMPANSLAMLPLSHHPSSSVELAVEPRVTGTEPYGVDDQHQNEIPDLHVRMFIDFVDNTRKSAVIKHYSSDDAKEVIDANMVQNTPNWYIRKTAKIYPWSFVPFLIVAWPVVLAIGCWIGSYCDTTPTAMFPSSDDICALAQKGYTLAASSLLTLDFVLLCVFTVQPARSVWYAISEAARSFDHFYDINMPMYMFDELHRGDESEHKAPDREDGQNIEQGNSQSESGDGEHLRSIRHIVEMQARQLTEDSILPRETLWQKLAACCCAPTCMRKCFRATSCCGVKLGPSHDRLQTAELQYEVLRQDFHDSKSDTKEAKHPRETLLNGWQFVRFRFSLLLAYLICIVIYVQPIVFELLFFESSKRFWVTVAFVHIPGGFIGLFSLFYMQIALSTLYEKLQYNLMLMTCIGDLSIVKLASIIQKNDNRKNGDRDTDRLSASSHKITDHEVMRAFILWKDLRNFFLHHDMSLNYQMTSVGFFSVFVPALCSIAATTALFLTADSTIDRLLDSSIQLLIVVTILFVAHLMSVLHKAVGVFREQGRHATFLRHQVNAAKSWRLANSNDAVQENDKSFHAAMDEIMDYAQHIDDNDVPPTLMGVPIRPTFYRLFLGYISSAIIVIATRFFFEG
jgi:hypothetical protein